MMFCQLSKNSETRIYIWLCFLAITLVGFVKNYFLSMYCMFDADIICINMQ